MIIDVLLNPAEITVFANATRARPDACVVFDILRATTSMVRALYEGATGVRPVLEITEALARREADSAVLLAGERQGDKITGFDLGNSPAEFEASVVNGREIVMTTTNGTVAMHACRGVDAVYAAAFLNLGATIRSVRALGPGSVTVLSAGTFETTALEDVIAAGAFCAAFPDAERTDAAHVAYAVWESCCGCLDDLVRSSRNARKLFADGRGDDVTAALWSDSAPVVGRLDQDGVVRRFS